MTRRQFMRAAAGSAILLLVGCRTAGEVELTADDPATATPAAAVASSPGAIATPTPREIIITPTDEFYVMKVFDIPTVDADDWHLTIDGLVDNPLRLTYEEILARPAIELMRTLECIGNPVGGDQIGNAVWTGTGLADLLADAGIQAAARRALFEAADGYETSVTLDWITRPDVMLAYLMNGEPLTAEHGYPLRLFIPGLYGQKMPKWITRISFISEEHHLGVWEAQGWSNVAAVKTNAQIWFPRHISELAVGEMEITGVAYAGDRAIRRVEVGIEQEGQLTWLDAELLPGPTAEVWTQFYLSWTPPEPGVYTLLVRATDEDGFTQLERARGVLEGAFPDGTDRIHNIVVKVI